MAFCYARGLKTRCCDVTAWMELVGMVILKICPMGSLKSSVSTSLCLISLAKFGNFAYLNQACFKGRIVFDGQYYGKMLYVLLESQALELCFWSLNHLYGSCPRSWGQRCLERLCSPFERTHAFTPAVVSCKG